MTAHQEHNGAWWRGAVAYQVYVRSFRDSNGDGIGDLPGVTQSLDDLAKLGVNAIWLNPCYPSPQHDHGYDIADYRQILPDYGTLADFDQLVAHAHARDIRVLMDIVPNHCSSEHQWFIDAIKQRNETLQRTMEAIIYLQRDFFLTGDEATLHPMILKDVAERAGYDISTISRVSNSKYVQTNFGIYPLKYFFSESMQTDTGEEISTREVKKIMKEHVDAEDKRKPLTDEELATILKEKGYVIARRTVAKYREQLGIPVARLRKEI